MVRPLQLPLLTPESRWRPPSELPSLAGVKRIALDVETCDPDLNRLGPGVRRGAYIAGLALGTGDGRRWYFPIRHEAGGNMDPRVVMNWARDELNNFEGDVAGSQLLYDLDHLAEEGVHLKKVRRFHDIQNAEPLINENRFAYGLEHLSRDYLGIGKETALINDVRVAYGWKTDKELKQNLWRLPPALVGPYAEGDVDRPLRILPLQFAKLEKEDLLDLYDIEARLIPLLLAMRRRGVRVDVARAERIRAELDKKRAEWLRVVRGYAGPRAEWLAADVLGRALEERGVKVPRTGKTGAYSVTKELLERHAADPLVHAIREGRKINTIITTFIDGHVLGHAVKGRIHCEFNQLKSDDGGTIARFSSSNPNLQNIPARDEELAPMIRGLFLPEEGEEWERADYSQIEYRFLAHFAVGPGADACRQSYNDDPKTDYHKFVANMLGVDPEDKIKRKRVKNTNFAKGYGAGAPKLAATFGCSVEEAQEFVTEYDEKLPFAKSTYELADRRAAQRGYVTTILKRRRRFPLWEPAHNPGKKPGLPREEALKNYGDFLKRAYTYRALNGVLQGSAADLMKKAMVDIWDAGICDVLGAPLVTVHDELGNSIAPTPEAQEASREVKRLMESAIKLRVPVIAEVERGPDWGACK